MKPTAHTGVKNITSQAQKEANKRYKDKNKERLITYSKNYYDSNRDSILEKHRISYYLMKTD